MGQKSGTYQRSTAEEDHEDDEGLKPVVLHDAEAGFADVPPNLPSVAGDVHIEAGKPLHTAWRWDKELWVISWPGQKVVFPPTQHYLCFYYLLKPS